LAYHKVTLFAKWLHCQGTARYNTAKFMFIRVLQFNISIIIKVANAFVQPKGKHIAMGVEHSPWPRLRVVPRCWLSPVGVSSVATSGPRCPPPSVPIMHSPPAVLPPAMR